MAMTPEEFEEFKKNFIGAADRVRFEMMFKSMKEETRAEVHMQDAIEEMVRGALNYIEPDEEPIPMLPNRYCACLRLLNETWNRLYPDHKVPDEHD